MNKTSRKKKCPFCNERFLPRANIKNQMSCGKKKCQQKRKVRNAKQWRKKHPSFQASHKLDDEYRKSHCNWKKNYRKNHPEYVHKNRIYWKKWKLMQVKAKSIVSRKEKYINENVGLYGIKQSPPNRVSQKGVNLGKAPYGRKIQAGKDGGCKGPGL